MIESLKQDFIIKWSNDIEWYGMVFSNTEVWFIVAQYAQVPLREQVKPNSGPMVLNGIFKYYYLRLPLRHQYTLYL